MRYFFVYFMSAPFLLFLFDFSNFPDTMINTFGFFYWSCQLIQLSSINTNYRRWQRPMDYACQGVWDVHTQLFLLTAFQRIAGDDWNLSEGFLGAHRLCSIHRLRARRGAGPLSESVGKHFSRLAKCLVHLLVVLMHSMSDLSSVIWWSYYLT